MVSDPEGEKRGQVYIYPMGDRVAQNSSFVLGGSAFTIRCFGGSQQLRSQPGLNDQVLALTMGASYTRQARSGFDADGVMVKAQYVV